MIDSSAGGRLIRVAIACSNCARRTPAAVACARVVCSSASAVMTSSRAKTPTANWFSVIFSDRSYCLAVLFSSRCRVSAIRRLK